QPDGGRRHGRDLPLPDLAVGAPQPRRRARRARRDRTRGRRRRGEAALCLGSALRGARGLPDRPRVRTTRLRRYEMTETIIRMKERFGDGELLEPDDPPTSALAECTCPDFCERDHDNE